MSRHVLTRRNALAGMGGLAASGVAGGRARAATTVRMWTFLNPTGKTGREVAMKTMIDNFEAANPGVSIVVETQNYKTMTDKFLAAHQTGTAPDVIWMINPQIWSAIKLGALANLNDLFVKNWSQADLEDIDSPFWRYGATPKARYQVFVSWSVYCTLYRADLFKAAGIDPKSLTTWDKLIAAAQKLTVRDATGTVTRWGFGEGLAGQIPMAPPVFNVLMDKDGSIFDKDFRARWSTPAGVQGLEMELDMIRKYKVTPDTAISTDLDSMFEQFYAGRFAMIRGGNARFTIAQANLGAENVGYLGTPSFTEGKASPEEASGWCIGVWSGSKQAELAGKWVEYMASKQGDTLWATVGGQVPIRRSTIAEHPEFFSAPKNAWYAQVAADMRANAWLPPEEAGAGGWDEGLNNAAQDVWVNHTDPKAALEKAEEAFNRTRRR